MQFIKEKQVVVKLGIPTEGEKITKKGGQMADDVPTHLLECQLLLKTSDNDITFKFLSGPCKICAIICEQTGRSGYTAWVNLRSIK